MGEALVPQERLQPSLLDRLTDDEPDKKVEARGAARAVQGAPAPGRAARPGLALQHHAPRVGGQTSRSTRMRGGRSINFGLPALSGLLASSLDVIDLERAVRQAIIDFEPRIVAKTLRSVGDGARRRRWRTTT